MSGSTSIAACASSRILAAGATLPNRPIAVRRDAFADYLRAILEPATDELCFQTEVKFSHDGLTFHIHYDYDTAGSAGFEPASKAGLIAALTWLNVVASGMQVGEGMTEAVD